MKKVVSMLVMAVLAAAGHASVISWAYDNGNDVLGTAGVEPAMNWNETRPEDTGGSSLNYDDGTASGVTLSVAGGFGAWGIGGATSPDANGTYNKAVFDGYYNSIGSTLTLSSIPYAAYNIIAYISSDQDGRTGTVSDGSTTFSFSTNARSMVDNDPSMTLIQTIDTGLGYPSANYAVFSNLTGANQTLTIANASDGMGFAGIQIVEAVTPLVTVHDPANGETGVATDLSDRAIANNLSWLASADPNIAEIKGYDLYLDPNAVKVSNRDLGCLIADSTAADVTQYDPASNFNYLTTYYWVVDTRYTRDDDPNLGTANEKIYVGSPAVWSFETISGAPIIATYNSVVVTETMLPATLSAVVTDADGDLSSAAFTLLTDDINWPLGATASLLNINVSNPYAPSCQLTADTPGFYKVRLTVTDGTNITRDIAEVAVFDNACAAAQFNWQTWPGFNAMDFNQDCTVDLTDLAAFALQWLDDRSLQAPENYDWAIPYTPLVNGIINGNFETGDLLGYYQENVAITDVDPFEGTYSAQWTVTGGRGGVVSYRNLKASTSYEFSVQIIGGATGGTNEFMVRKGGAAVYATAEGQGWTPSGTVQTVTMPFATLETDEGATFEFIIFGTTDGTYYKIDDLRLVEVAP